MSLPGTLRVEELNKFLKPGETPWPFPGSPSQWELERRAERAIVEVNRYVVDTEYQVNRY